MLALRTSFQAEKTAHKLRLPLIEYLGVFSNRFLIRASFSGQL
jgi:hypothetical protein